jgi:EmrB/QacA subfamily drug resistance transporter
MTVNLISMKRSQEGLILASVTTSGFLTTFVTSGVNVALPEMARELKLSAVMISWVSLSFILAAGALLMPMGRVADLRGRKTIYLIGLSGFTVFCLASAVAPNALVLLLTRAFQGLSTAFLYSTTVALVTLSYPPERRGRALGLQVSGVYLGLTIGPMLGGIITENLGWRALFAVVGALGLANMALSIWKFRGLEWKEPRTARFDIRGSVLWALALSALLIGFSYLPDVVGGVLIAIGVVGILTFFVSEGRAPDPILNVDLLRRNRVFAFSNIASFVNYAATAAMTFLMSLYLQYNRGLDAQMAGFVLVTGTALQAAVSPLAGRLADRLEARYVAAAGMALCAVGLLGFVFLGENTRYWQVIIILCVLGLGFGLFASPIIHAIMGSVDKRFVGTATATSATMRVSGQSISMGIATLVLAVMVGRHEIAPADYPHLLASIRVTFAIFVAMCAGGLVASLIGPSRKTREEPNEG